MKDASLSFNHTSLFQAIPRETPRTFEPERNSKILKHFILCGTIEHFEIVSQLQNVTPQGVDLHIVKKKFDGLQLWKPLEDKLTM